MGYYDEHRPSYPRRRRGTSFLSGLIGGIIGALLVVFIQPYLGLSNNTVDQSPFYEENKDQQGAITQNVSLEVTTDITKAVERASKSVVGITNIQTSNFWFNQTSREAGVGSGVIYKKAGDVTYIVTNHHVVDGASQIEVTLNDGTKVEAKLRGSDIWTDLAVVEISSEGISDEMVAEFGNSDTLKIGEAVLAIGNPLGLEFSGSVTQGIISGINRTVPVDINNDGYVDWQAEVIQTDAAINPGNSGGALVNIAGQVIGINSMKIAREAVEGIGFSIPINYVIPVIEDLEKFGEVKRPQMGITLRNLSDIPVYHQEHTLKLPKEVKSGVIVESVLPNSPADRAGLEQLDVIVELDGQTIENIIQLRKHLYNEKKVGDQMRVTFYRKGELKEVTIYLTEENQL